MSVVRSVPRQLTEDAVRLLHTTYVDYAVANIHLRTSRGRGFIGASRFGAHSPSDVTGQACVFRMVSIVEAYLDLLSSDLLGERTPRGHALARLLVEAVEQRSSANWHERRSAFATFHDTPLGTLDGWLEIDAAIVARNAIAHGLGRLTSRQQTSGTAGKLARIGITLRNDQLIVTTTSVITCRDACLRLIRDADFRTR